MRRTDYFENNLFTLSMNFQNYFENKLVKAKFIYGILHAAHIRPQGIVL